MAQKKISQKRRILKIKPAQRALVDGLRDTADRKIRDSHHPSFPAMFEDVPQLPLDYLLHASEKSLDGFYLDRMSRATNLEKELRVVLQQAVENLAQAQTAQWVRKCRAARQLPLGGNVKRLKA